MIINKYSLWYNNLITKAVKRNLTKKSGKELFGYVEKHHIIPKSLGGSNLKSNIVYLLAREHFICHWLLTKFTTDNDRYKMTCAWVRMISSKSTAYIPSSRVYKLLKEKMIIAMD